MQTLTLPSRKNFPICLRSASNLLLLFAGCAGLNQAQAATIAFTFSGTAETAASGIPSPSNLTLPTTVLGTVSFTPFGTSRWSESGLITFALLPTGSLVPAFTMNEFTFSFGGGTDSFSGTSRTAFGPPNSEGLPTLSTNFTILSGTGIFAGATGTATQSGVSHPGDGPTTPVNISGTGQITAPSLTAAPEPATFALFVLALTGALIWRKATTRKAVQVQTSNIFSA
jgi:hypothetical protein